MRRKQRHAFGWGIWIWAIASATAFLIVGGANAQGGQLAYQHPNQLPTGVHELNSGAYEVRDNLVLASLVLASQICWGTDSTDDTSITASVPIPDSSLTIVKCSAGQEWGVHAGHERNWGRGIVETWESPLYWLLVVAGLAVCMLPLLFTTVDWGSLKGRLG